MAFCSGRHDTRPGGYLVFYDSGKLFGALFTFTIFRVPSSKLLDLKVLGKGYAVWLCKVKMAVGKANRL